MKQLRRIIAIVVGKLVIYLSRILGNQGSDIPGIVARRIYPPILKKLAANVTRGIILVTGTNGKTTTTNMIAQIIKEKGYSFVHNRAGANMLTGITGAFINKTNWWGRNKFDYALLETDENTLPLLMKEMKPQMVLITNFFRDQLDRYGELDTTIKVIQEAIKNNDIELLLNGDDPLMTGFAGETGLSCRYYGFEDTVYDSFMAMESREGRFCIKCGQELEYRRYHYAQLGRFNCPHCGNTNPPLAFTGRHLEMKPTIEFEVNDLLVRSNYQGFYNAYNILAAVAMAKVLGVGDEIIQYAILKYIPRAGRMEQFFIHGTRTILILVKNPTGLNQALASILNDPLDKNLFLALNDNAADGRDISWIWDADMEMLAAADNIHKIVCSGKRSGDMAVRVKYCGFDISRLEIHSELRTGIERVTVEESGVNYILCTYTALFAARKILTRMQKEASPLRRRRLFMDGN